MNEYERERVERILQQVADAPHQPNTEARMEILKRVIAGKLTLGEGDAEIAKLPEVK